MFKTMVYMLDFKRDSFAHVCLFQVAEWTELLLDAHLTQLILSNEIHEDLKRLGDIIEKNVSIVFLYNLFLRHNYNNIIGLVISRPRSTLCPANS